MKINNIFLISFFLLILSVVNAQNSDSIKVTGGYNFVMKVGNVNDNLKKINLNNEKNYEINLISCNSYEKYCAFIINDIPTGKLKKDSTFKLDNEYSLKVTNIQFDFCDNRRFCHIGYEAYNIIDLTIDGPVKPFCGNGICDSGENCEEDSCCNGKKAYLDSDDENCRICGYKCKLGFTCSDGRCIEQCPETSGCDYFTNPYCGKTPKKVGDECDCNEECGSMGCFNGKCVSNEKTDLRNYPNLLIRDGKIDVTLVVGDKSSSLNVLAQTNIALSLTALKSAVIKNRLASEVADLNQNIISVGNPCVNEISAKIMNNPQPCDKDFPSGKGYIKLFEKQGFVHIVVAGYSDIGTKNAADILANYQKYNFNSNEYAVNVEGETIKDEDDKETDIEENEIFEDDVINEKEDVKVTTVPDTTLGETQDTTKIETKKEIKEDNIIKRFISWLRSLFK